MKLSILTSVLALSFLAAARLTVYGERPNFNHGVAVYPLLSSPIIAPFFSKHSAPPHQHSSDPIVCKSFETVETMVSEQIRC
jgi:hypothetical protein